MVRSLVILLIATTAFAAPTPKVKVDPAQAHVDRAKKLAEAKDVAGALAEHRLVLAVREKASGKDSAEAADAYGLIAVDLFQLGKLDDCQQALERQLAIREKVLGPDHVGVADVHADLFDLYKAKGDALDAGKHAELALAIREKALGPNALEVAQSLEQVAQVYSALRRTADAEKAYVRERAIYTALGGHAFELASIENGLGDVYKNADRYVEAEAQYRRALGMLPPDSLDRIQVMNGIGEALLNQSDYEKALVELERALALATEKLGADHVRLAETLQSMGTTYGYMGDYKHAVAAFERSLAIHRKQPGRRLEEYIAENNLGQVLSESRDDAGALAHFQVALEAFKKLLGEKHPHIGSVLLNISVVLNHLGNAKEARAHAQQALAILEAANPDAATVANASNILGDFEADLGNFAVAERLYQRSIAINTKLRGTDNRITAEAVRALGLFYLQQGKLQDADTQLANALAMMLRSQTPNHPSVSETRSHLAQARWKQGRVKEAEEMFRTAIREGELALSPDHPRLLDPINRLSSLLAMTGRESEALAMRGRSIQIRNRELGLRLAIGSERQKLEAFPAVESELRTVISLLVHHWKTEAATRMTFDLVLRRKGRVLDAMTRYLEALRARLSDADRALLDQLDTTRAYLATLMVKAPSGDRSAHVAKIAALTARLEELETKLGAAGSSLVGNDGEGLDVVQRAVPAGAALVEIVRYGDTNPAARTWAGEVGPAHYIAFVLHHDGAPAWVDLGDAEAIDRAVAALRHSLSDPTRTDVAVTTRAIDRLVMQPVRPLLRDVRAIFLAPDGSLNLVPFAAFRDEHGRYLIESYQFTYLNTGRDLARFGHRIEPRQPALLIGAPEFGSTSATQTNSGRSADFAIQFTPLPGTATELADLARLMPAARSLRGLGATESALKSTHGPAILHIASHGFFLEDEEIRPGSRGLVKTTRSGGVRVIENPLLRSGVALAGANGTATGGDDGILTALEVSGLDLRGTRLVVLSACDTGIGDVQNGNGVFGLRRALVTAGAETQVMSLWKVDDRATHDLMTAYYQAITSGRGRSESMRSAQHALARDPKRAHPYYWASFIVSGDGRGLDGEPEHAPAVLRGPRGCACNAGDGPPLALAAVVLVALRRRRRATGSRSSASRRC